MKQFNIPRLLKFDLNKIFQLVEKAGITFGQSQDIIEGEKREIEKKLIDELNFVLYLSGSDGLKRHINHYLDQLDILKKEELEYYQRWHNQKKPFDNSNLFLAKYMSDIYCYI